MLKFALKNMAIKKVQIILIVLSIVISAGIGVLAFNVATQVDEGITSGAAYYSVIVGPAGSKTQLAMNTMYFADAPLGTVPYSVVSALLGDSRVTSAIPFAIISELFSAPSAVASSALEISHGDMKRLYAVRFVASIFPFRSYIVPLFAAIGNSVVICSMTLD